MKNERETGSKLLFFPGRRRVGRGGHTVALEEKEDNV